MPDNYILFVIAVAAAFIVAFIAIRTMRKKPGANADAQSAAPAEEPTETGHEEGDSQTISQPQESAENRESGENRESAENRESGPPDTLTHIKGLGPKAAAKLNERGITRFAQVAAWSEADIAALDSELGNMAERIERDRWVEQADLLAKGDIAGFEAKFGRLG